MTRPGRRVVLKGLALAATWPAFLRRAFAAAVCAQPLPALGVLAARFRTAAQLGKPLLVLVVPVDQDLAFQRGQAFGEWLNHGGEEALAPLSLCELAAAPVSVLRELVPNVGPGEPTAVLVETRAVPTTVRRLDEPLPAVVEPARIRGEGQIALLDAQVDANIALLTRWSREALGWTEAGLRRRAGESGRALSFEDQARLAAESPERDPERIWRGAAVLAMRARTDERLRAQLASAARERWVRARIPGSKWAHFSGCGEEIEGEEPSQVDCGMGFVARRSERFLYLLTRQP